MPYEVTPPMTLELPMKLGPPESPKQVPPVWALFDSRMEKLPVNPGVLICSSFGVASMRTRSDCVCHEAASGKLFCRP